jgi:hypothetical protein
MRIRNLMTALRQGARTVPLAGLALAAATVLVPAPAEVFAQQPPRDRRGDTYRDPLADWCRDTLLRLREARRYARDASSRGDAESARLQLVRGMTSALGSGADDGLLTRRALRRGIEIARAIEREAAQARTSARTAAYFLFAYYDFLEEVIETLDLPYSIHDRDCDRCRDEDFDLNYEQAFVDYARRQVEVVLQTLVDDRRAGGLTPIGTPSAYFAALEVSAEGAAHDLRDSLWASRYACQIRGLEGLAARLGAHLRGGGPYRNDVQALRWSHAEASDLVAELDNGSNCRSRRGRDE